VVGVIWMKIIKLKEGDVESKVSVGLISKFGQALYSCPEVKAVILRVDFKDGSTICFERDEDDDDLERITRRRMEDEG